MMNTVTSHMAIWWQCGDVEHPAFSKFDTSALCCSKPLSCDVMNVNIGAKIRTNCSGDSHDFHMMHPNPFRPPDSYGLRCSNNAGADRQIGHLVVLGERMHAKGVETHADHR